MSNEVEIIIKSTDRSAAGFDSAEKKARGLGDTMKSVGTTAAGFLTANIVQAGASKVFDFMKDSVIGFNSQLQNANIAFTTMLGSSQKAGDFLGQLQTFAKTTPFDFPQLVKSAQNMMGMGISAQNVIPDLKALGDSVASVGGSADQVDQVTLAFDQMAAKGTLDMGNMNQLLQGGVPNALKILADSYGKTTGQMIQMISTGKIQSSEALPKLIDGIEHGTKSVKGLGGMMDQQSHTMSGALSNIKDGLQQAVAGGLRPFFDLASTGAQKLGNFFSGDKFSKFSKDVQDSLKEAIDWVEKFVKSGNMKPLITAFGNVKSFFTKDLIPIIKSLVDTFGPLIIDIGKKVWSAVGPLSGAIRPIGDVLKDVFGFVDAHKTTFQALAVSIGAIVVAQKAWMTAVALWTAATKIGIVVQAALNLVMSLNPIGVVILAIIALAAGFTYLWKHSAAFRDFWKSVWNDILHAIRFVVDLILDYFGTIIHAAANAFGWIPGLGGKLKSAASEFDKFKAHVNSALDGIHDKTVHVYTVISPPIMSQRATLLHHGGMAHGGIVGSAAGGGPRSNMTLVGENGPELVDLAPGSTVHSNADSAAMMTRNGQGGEVTVTFDFTGADQEFKKFIKKLVRVDGGGNVQTALGS